MISSEHQKAITEAWIVRFQAALDKYDDPGYLADSHPLVRQAFIDALKSQIEECKEEIREYETKIRRDTE